MAEQTTPPQNRPRVGLLVTCLVDLLRPEIGFATIKLLEEAGCEVLVPEAQTCCGQPGFNAGATDAAAALARQVIEQFGGFDYLIIPSGSCASMVKSHYKEALAGDPAWLPRAEALAAKTYELMSFLVDVRGYKPDGVRLNRSASYHDSCSGLRELNIFKQPRTLLGAVDGLDLKPLPGNDVCCGFGGTFCVKYPAISNAIVGEKAKAAVETDADLLLGGDLGCLINIAGKLSRNGDKVRVMHAAEVIAGMGDGPAIGEESERDDLG
ncbi:MAG: (Fe-S)-binding protein [Pseudomonadota bacterium]